MSTAAKIVDPHVMTIEVTDDEIIAHLVYGRTISVPLVWSWRLADASREQRQHWEILGDGEGVRCPTLTRISAWKACCTGCLPVVSEEMQASLLERRGE